MVPSVIHKRYESNGAKNDYTTSSGQKCRDELLLHHQSLHCLERYRREREEDRAPVEHRAHDVERAIDLFREHEEQGICRPLHRTVVVAVLVGIPHPLCGRNRCILRAVDVVIDILALL